MYVYNTMRAAARSIEPMAGLGEGQSSRCIRCNGLLAAVRVALFRVVCLCHPVNAGHQFDTFR